MKKQKTHKGAAKRFKVTKSGKILHRSHYIRHLKSKKSKKRQRSLNQLKKTTGRYKKKIAQLLAIK